MAGLATPNTGMKRNVEGKVGSTMAGIGNSLLMQLLSHDRMSAREASTLLAESELLQGIDLSNIPVGSSLSVSYDTEQPEAKADIVVKDDTSQEIARFSIVNNTYVTNEGATATNNTLNSLNESDVGRVLLEEMPEKARSAVDTVQGEADYSSAPRYAQNAIAKTDKGTPFEASDAVKADMRSQRGSQDRSRVSKEHHEWKYNVISSTTYHYASNCGAYQFNYLGADALENEDHLIPREYECPPYYQWLKHDALREIIKIYRRYRRYRMRCGGKALYTEQGFAFRDEAIQDDCANDAEFQAQYAILVATADFS